jgi:hypothetical protein
MLSKVDVVGPSGSTLSLPLADTSAGYILKGIEGLDPVKATLVSSSFAQLDGSQFQSARRENRNVILTVGIEPYSGGATVRSLRAALYAYFMPKTVVTLKFYDDDVFFASIVGTIESCETPLFSKDPELNISIVCFDPAFSAASATSVSGNTVSSSSSTEQTINYPGSVETGYLFTLNVNRSISGFTLYMRRAGGSALALDFAASLVSGDVVKISTASRDKYARLTHSGVESSVLFDVSKSSIWTPLWPGDNFLRVKQADTGAAIPFTLAYTTKYGGL